MKMLYADVIIDISAEELDRSFSYRIPEELAERICIGSAVTVPFGRSGRMMTGWVVDLKENCEYPDENIKSIVDVVTGENVVEDGLVQLAVWMKKRYGCTLNQALHTVLPWRKKVKDKIERKVILSLSEEEAREILKELERKNQKARVRVLRLLIENTTMPYERLLHETNTTAAVLRQMEEKNIIKIESGIAFRSVVEESDMIKVSPLSPLQENAALEIQSEWQGKDRPVLLYGITGSGKTEVYMKMIEKVLSEGKQAIVLIPEIALTYQTVGRFVRRFGQVVSFLHSRLSEGEKFDQFKAAKSGHIKIMVGPRSALFTPFPNLGLIVVDEEHEGSYASEVTPRYHARETAVERGKISHAHVILGSASPSLESFYRCEKEEYCLVRLKERFGESSLPETVIVDMRKELSRGNRSILSACLRKELEDRLEKNEQSMLFLNRRGLAGFVSCRSCGHVEKCPHCDVSMTHHRNGRLICHYCGYEKPMMKICPTCGSALFGGIKIGTEAVENLLVKEFPNARVLRMDMDTTGGKEGHEKKLKAFAEGEADILIGTQMIVKGHDFPRVTLVGALLADLSLNDQDYRSAERTFQLILQASGRAGRGEKKGLSVIQTYEPEHYALMAAASQDYDSFYKEEMSFRKMMAYPPCGTMMAILGSSKDEAKLDQGMAYLRQMVDRMDASGKLMTIGPAPQSIGKVRDYYRRVIYLRHRDRKVLEEARNRIEKYIEINWGFQSLNIQFDMNV